MQAGVKFRGVCSFACWTTSPPASIDYCTAGRLTANCPNVGQEDDFDASGQENRVTTKLDGHLSLRRRTVLESPRAWFGTLGSRSARRRSIPHPRTHEKLGS